MDSSCQGNQHGYWIPYPQRNERICRQDLLLTSGWEVSSNKNWARSALFSSKAMKMFHTCGSGTCDPSISLKIGFCLPTVFDRATTLRSPLYIDQTQHQLCLCVFQSNVFQFAWTHQLGRQMTSTNGASQGLDQFSSSISMCHQKHQSQCEVQPSRCWSNLPSILCSSLLRALLMIVGIETAHA